MLFSACPPHAYDVSLRMGDQVSKRMVIAEDSLRVEISGYHTPFWSADWVGLYFRFEGMKVADLKACERLTGYNSNKYSLNLPGVYHRNHDECGMQLIYEHADPDSMTIAEMRDYLDSTSLSLTFRMPSGETREINVLFDRDWLIKRWIPKEHREALRE